MFDRGSQLSDSDLIGTPDLEVVRCSDPRENTYRGNVSWHHGVATTLTDDDVTLMHRRFPGVHSLKMDRVVTITTVCVDIQLENDIFYTCMKNSVEIICAAVLPRPRPRVPAPDANLARIEGPGPADRVPQLRALHARVRAGGGGAGRAVGAATAVCRAEGSRVQQRCADACGQAGCCPEGGQVGTASTCWGQMMCVERRSGGCVSTFSDFAGLSLTQTPFGSCGKTGVWDN